MASANMDLVRSLYAAWERGDFSSVEWADPEIEFVVAPDGPDPGTWRGLAGMAAAAREHLLPWADVRFVPDEYRELDDGCVLVLDRFSGRGKRSGVTTEEVRTAGAHLFHIREGRVTRIVRYQDRDRVLAELGIPKDGPR